MAKVSLTKIRITGLQRHYKLLLQELHRMGILEIIETQEFIDQSIGEAEDYYGVFDLARIDFAIKFLSSRESGKSKMDGVLSGGKLQMSEEEAKNRLKKFSPLSEKVMSSCERISEESVRAKNELKKIEYRRQILMPFKLLKTPLQESFNTQKTRTWIGLLSASQQKKFEERMASESHLMGLQILGEEAQRIAVRVTAYYEMTETVQEILNAFGFEEVDFSQDCAEFFGQKPREVLHSLEKEEQEYEQKLKALEEEACALAVHLDDLRILADYNAWRKKKNDLQRKILKTKNLFAFEAWMPNEAYEKLEHWIQNAFVGEVSVDKAEPEEGEKIPVFVHNKKGISSFEPITELFGTPNNEDIDPTPAVAPFFFIFFGLCLSDVGYGMILTLVAMFFLLFGKFSRSAKEGLLLVLFCGIAAVGGGVVLGGYFGMTAEQAPGFLLNSEFLAGVENVLPFKGQIIDPMAGSGPIRFLGLAMALGVIQLLTGVALDFVKRIKNHQIFDAFCDPLAWFFFLVALLGFGLSGPLGLNKILWTKLALAGAIILVFTQSRNQKNWFLKPITGVLSLYNVTGYLSDILSYSRLMALGLSTGVIGFAMNLTAGVLSEMMPWKALGFVVAVVILVFGHTLNFFISLLGAFVHSGRLQFIEFFGKFFEGGGRKFKPFVREKKYLFFRNS